MSFTCEMFSSVTGIAENLPGEPLEWNTLLPTSFWISGLDDMMHKLPFLSLVTDDDTWVNNYPVPSLFFSILSPPAHLHPGAEPALWTAPIVPPAVDVSSHVRWRWFIMTNEVEKWGQFLGLRPVITSAISTSSPQDSSALWEQEAQILGKKSKLRYDQLLQNLQAST